MSNLTSSHSSQCFTVSKLLAFLFIIGVSFGGAITTVHAQTEEKVVAVVNGRSITQKDVDSAVISQLLPLQQQIYALRKAAMENFILRAILEDEAKKRGVSVEELRKQLTAGKVEVLPSQVEKEYIENANVFGTMSPDEVKEKLRLDLENQARLQKYHEALIRVQRKIQYKSSP